MKNQDKKIYGLIGYPVGHSLSPAMHNAAFKACGINAEYRLFEVKPEELETFLLKTVFEKNIYGLNITIPHKVKALEIARFAGRTDRIVELCGAINTVKRQDNKLIVHNTDMTGFMDSLIKELKFNTQGKSIFIIGCGGAARAVIAGLTQKGTGIKKIYVYDINNEAIESAKKHFKNFSDILENILEKLEFVAKERIADVIKECDLLINATPCGMRESDPCPIDENLIHSNLLVYDLIYNPTETKLLKIAKEKGAKVSNGLGMLLYQGAAAFELWTGKKAPIGVMRKALEEGVKKI